MSDATILTIDNADTAKFDAKALKRNGIKALVFKASRAQVKPGSSVKAESQSSPTASEAQPTLVDPKIIADTTSAGLAYGVLLQLSDKMKDQLDLLPVGAPVFVEAKSGMKIADIDNAIQDIITVMGADAPPVIVLKIDQKTAKEFESVYDNELADWTSLWIIDEPKRDEPAQLTPEWPQATWPKWKMWEFSDIDLKELGKYKASCFNGPDEDEARFFAGQAPSVASAGGQGDPNASKSSA
jgi:hypothetical protein